MKKPIKVLIIDDSALVRKILSEIFAAVKDIEVIGSARDPLQAVKILKKNKPDVITLDLQMPRMDGLTFLRKIMHVYPLPVIVISSLTREGSKETIKALEMGALDFVAKPTVGISSGLEELKNEIIKKVRGAAGVNMGVLKKRGRDKVIKKEKNKKTIKKELSPELRVDSTIELIAIGASTGGTVAVRKILKHLPEEIPGMIVVLHMPAMFTTSYAENLNKSCLPMVKEVKNGEEFKKGVVYIAPGDRHLVLEQGVSGYFFKTDKKPKINHVRPAIDKTFKSIANIVAPNCIGVILTGMGRDGVEGLKKMHSRKAVTIAQDRETSVVFGMPGKAIESGVVDKVLPLDKIAAVLMDII